MGRPAYGQIRIEKRFGKPFWEVVREHAAKGLTRTETARAIGYSESSFCDLVDRHDMRHLFRVLGRARKGVARDIDLPRDPFAAALQRVNRPASQISAEEFFSPDRRRRIDQEMSLGLGWRLKVSADALRRPLVPGAAYRPHAGGLSRAIPA